MDGAQSQSAKCAIARRPVAKTADATAFARSYTAFTRAFSESSLRQGLFEKGSGDPATVAGRFYGLMETALAATPEAYPFDDLTLAVMVRRR